MAAPDYRTLAAQARTDADKATLVNVRERCLRAEAAWLAMATKQDLAGEGRARSAQATPVAEPTLS